ncbi:hypothetical protein V6N13_082580 [Hibiscus sabdariffa]
MNQARLDCCSVGINCQGFDFIYARASTIFQDRMTKGMSQQRQRVLQISRLSSRPSFDALFVLGYLGKYSDQIAIPFVFFFSASAENLGRASEYLSAAIGRTVALPRSKPLPPLALNCSPLSRNPFEAFDGNPRFWGRFAVVRPSSSELSLSLHFPYRGGPNHTLSSPVGCHLSLVGKIKELLDFPFSAVFGGPTRQALNDRAWPPRVAPVEFRPPQSQPLGESDLNRP